MRVGAAGSLPADAYEVVVPCPSLELWLGGNLMLSMAKGLISGVLRLQPGPGAGIDAFLDVLGSWHQVGAFAGTRWHQVVCWHQVARWFAGLVVCWHQVGAFAGTSWHQVGALLLRLCAHARCVPKCVCMHE